MERKICTQCKIEKHIENFDKKYTECKDCDSKRSLKRYYENKDELSTQRDLYYEESRDKLIQKRNDRYTNLRDLCRSYVELPNRWKAREEKVLIND